MSLSRDRRAVTRTHVAEDPWTARDQRPGGARPSVHTFRAATARAPRDEREALTRLIRFARDPRVQRASSLRRALVREMTHWASHQFIEDALAHETGPALRIWADVTVGRCLEDGVPAVWDRLFTALAGAQGRLTLRYTARLASHADARVRHYALLYLVSLPSLT